MFIEESDSALFLKNIISLSQRRFFNRLSLTDSALLYKKKISFSSFVRFVVHWRLLNNEMVSYELSNSVRFLLSNKRNFAFYVIKKDTT